MMDTSEQHRHRCETRHLIRQVSERGIGGWKAMQPAYHCARR